LIDFDQRIWCKRKVDQKENIAHKMASLSKTVDHVTFWSTLASISTEDATLRAFWEMVCLGER
jgi:hypothetical protein